MDISANDFAKTYSQMTEEQLLRLSEGYESLLPIARAALSAELQRRAIEVPIAKTPLIGERNSKWVNIELPRRSDKVLFPKMCPNCLRPDVGDGVFFDSLSHSKFRFTHVRHDYLSIKVPHCDQCARLVAGRRKQVAVYLIAAAIVSFGLGIWMNMHMFVTVLIFVALSLPAAWVFPSEESASLGDYDEKFIVFRFRNRKYAEAFKKINGVSETDIGAGRIAEFLKARDRMSDAK